jgi:hypothetical protein
MADQAVKLSADAEDFVAFAGKTAALGPKIRTSLKKSIRDAGKEIVKDVQTEVRKPPIEPGKHKVRINTENKGLRSAIANSIRVQIATGAKKQGVFIIADSKKMPASKRKLMRRYNRENGWRHPDLATAEKLSKISKRAARVGGEAGKNLGAKAADRARSKGTWHAQKGRPYFGKVLKEKNKLLEDKVIEALQEARKQAGLPS